MNVLRNELDRLADERFNLVRWKFVSVAVFVIAALGWGDIKPTSQLSGLLLLCCTGFLCAYTDSLFYRRGTATHVIAKFLREHQGADSESLLTRDYERLVNTCRHDGMFFLSDHVFQFIASAIFSIGPTSLGIIAYKEMWDPWFALIPLAALAINFIMFVVYRKKRGRLSTPL